MQHAKTRLAFYSAIAALLLGFMFADPALADGIGKIVAVVQQLFGGPVNPTATTGQVLTKQADGSLAFATPGAGSQTLAQTLGFGSVTGANDITQSSGRQFNSVAGSALALVSGAVTATSGTVNGGLQVTGSFADGGIASTTVPKMALFFPTVNYTNGTGHYEALVVQVAELSTPSGTNLLMALRAGGAGLTDELTVDNLGNLSTVGAIQLTGAGATPFIDSLTSTAAISAAGHGRIRFVTGTGWQVSSDGAAYSTLATGGVTNLQTAYAGGATIATTGSIPIAFSDVNTDTATVLSVNKSPAGAAAGNAFVVQSGANASGAAASISHAGSGFALIALASGTGGVANFQNTGTGTAPVLDLDNTGSNNGGCLRVTKEPSGAQSGDGLTVLMGTVSSGITSGSGLTITMASGKATGSAIAVTGGTVTTSAPVFTATQDWNAGGVTFVGQFLNVTDTASAAASLLMDLQVGGVSKFKVDKSGNVTVAAKLTVVGAIDPTDISVTGTTPFYDSTSSTAAVGAAGHGRIRFVTGTGWQVSTDGAAYTTLATGGVTNLQTAYNGGATIATTGSVPIAFSNTAADNGSVLTVTKNPAGSQTGVALDVVSGANTLSAAARITGSGLGDAVFAEMTSAGGSALSGFTSGASSAPTILSTNIGASNGASGSFKKQPAGAQSGSGIDVLMGGGGGVTSGSAISVTMTSAETSGSAVSLNGGTVTTSAPTITSVQTWNAGGVTFVGRSQNVTDTASSATSRLSQFQVGASDRGVLYKNGVPFWSDNGSLPYLITNANANLIVSSNTLNVARISYAAANTGGPVMQLMFSRGTTAAPGAVVDDDVIGQFEGAGYNGVGQGHVASARIRLQVDGVPVDGSSAPGRITLQTVPTGSLTGVDRWSVVAAGHLQATANLVSGWVASTTDASGALEVGFSRLGVSSVALGDGTAGSGAGTLTLTTLTSPAATSLSIKAAGTLSATAKTTTGHFVVGVDPAQDFATFTTYSSTETPLFAFTTATTTEAFQCQANSPPTANGIRSVFRIIDGLSTGAAGSGAGFSLNGNNGGSAMVNAGLQGYKENATAGNNLSSLVLFANDGSSFSVVEPMVAISSGGFVKGRSGCVFGMTASASDPLAALDNGISRLGAASLALGNGTAGSTTGALSLNSVNLLSGTALFFDSADGSTAPVSAANHGRIRYLDGTGWQVSSSGGAYATLAAGSSTWAAVLASGNTSGGTNPTLSGGTLDKLTWSAGAYSTTSPCIDGPSGVNLVIRSTSGNDIELVAQGAGRTFMRSGTNIATSGTIDGNVASSMFQASGSSAIIKTFRIQSTIDQNTGSTGRYEGLAISIVETSLASGANSLVTLRAGSAGTTDELIISNTGKVTTYSQVVTAGWGVPAIYASANSTGQTAANASVATFTVGASDGSFDVSAVVDVTTSTTHSFACTVTYTDTGSTSRTLTLPFAQLAGTFVTAITDTTGVGPYASPALRIRAKAATSITVATSGTFTTVTYNVNATISEVN